MASNLMICTSALKPLSAKKLNEAQEQGPRYILEGVFAELDKLNRNQRIYPKNEYLKHLAYLRDDIKKGEPLLGELDHPDDRFEVKLKEASHRVIDLWYDEAQNVVMGKIELLNTPNGKLAQSIVDQGIPLHISSRAAGSVNADNTVSIQQIYTYDLVCKPGFAGAVLHRVNESADAPKYTDDVRNFLQSSYKMESMNAAPQYGFVNEDMSVSEIKASANLRNEAKELQINNQIEINVEDMTKPLNENINPDQTVGKPLDISGNGASALGIPTTLEGDDKDKEDEKKEDVSDKAPEADDKPAESSDDKKEEDKKEEGTDEKCPKCGNSPCTCDDKKEDEKEDDGKKEKESVSEDKDSDDDKSEDDKESDDKDSEEGEGDEDKDKSDSGVEIIEVEAEFEGDDKDDDMIKDVEPDFGDDDDDKEEGEEDKDKEEGDESSEDKPKEEEKAEEAERTVDCDASKDKSSEKLYDDEKAKKEADKLADKAKDEIEEREDKLMKKLDDLRAAIEKKSKSKEESKNESVIMAQYPASMMMNESNFAEFVGLSESQKSKVVDYLRDNNFVDKKSINENWKNGVDYVAETPVWLKYAPENYKAMYEAASETVKKSIATTASYLLFENQYDINSFWENSGLASANERKLLNESFVNVLPKVTPVEKESNLPYSNEYIKQIADMASEYNRK